MVFSFGYRERTYSGLDEPFEQLDRLRARLGARSGANFPRAQLRERGDRARRHAGQSYSGGVLGFDRRQVSVLHATRNKITTC